jgi:hypothetical protein
MPKGLNSKTGLSHRFKDRTGMRSGRLVFTHLVGTSRHLHKIWAAICDCGNSTSTATPHKTKSCGCLQKEIAGTYQKAKAMPLEEKAARIKANAARQRQRRKTNPIRSMQSRLSRLHRHALMQVGAIKTSPTFEHLGYTPKDFKDHIERQFSRNMGWHNMQDWQIDHIIPISQAARVDDVIALNQLSNLRPMWSKENNHKKNKRTLLL